MNDNGDEAIVHEIAREVHEWATKYAAHHGFCDTLSCMCGIASAKLNRRLRYYKIKSQIFVARTCYEDKTWQDIHAFNVHNGIIYDITASQFDDSFMGQVVIVSIESPDSECYWWRHCDKMWTYETFVRRQIRHEWPDYQRAMPNE